MIKSAQKRPLVIVGNDFYLAMAKLTFTTKNQKSLFFFQVTI